MMRAKARSITHGIFKACYIIESLFVFFREADTPTTHMS